MLPRSTHERMGREANRGKQSGANPRNTKTDWSILMPAVNLKYLCEKTIQIDCDVIQADGGTRTANYRGLCSIIFKLSKIITMTKEQCIN